MDMKLGCRRIPTLTEIALGLDMITEVRGILPELDIYTQAFIECFAKRWDGGEGEYVIHGRDLDFKGIKPFFNRMRVIVSTYENNRVECTGEYDPWDPDKKGRFDVQIRLRLDYIPGYRPLALVRLKTCFAHEITHAYENLYRARHGAPTLGSQKYNERYKKFDPDDSIHNMSNYNGTCIANAARNMYYFIESVERNAFVASLRYELEPYVTAGTIKNSQELLKYALSSGTQLGKNYRIIQRSYEKMFKDWFKVKDGLDLVDFQQLNSDLNDLLGKDYSLGEDMIKIQKDWTKFEKIFKTKVLKVVSDVWNDFGPDNED